MLSVLEDLIILEVSTHFTDFLPLLLALLNNKINC